MAATKTPQDERYTDQDFDLFGALQALDNKDYGFYGRLTEEQQRKFIPYMLLHWMSAIKSGGILGSYYVLSTDQNANKHMFSEYVAKHPELQWMMLCSASPGTGKQFHQWIPHLSVGVTTLRDSAKIKDIEDYFSKIYKGASKDDIKVAATEFTEAHNHKWRLAKLWPELKRGDIEALANIVTPQDLAEWERLSGG